RVIPYYRFRNASHRIFGDGVADEVGTFNSPRYEDARQKFAHWTRAEIARLYREWPFDLFVLPFDGYYYVRDVPASCHELGVPVFVAQKEPSITDLTFEQLVSEFRDHAPFISDYMCVCSERHKRFWVDAGAHSDLIEVSGQPRFDVYRHSYPDLDWPALGLA